MVHGWPLTFLIHRQDLPPGYRPSAWRIGRILEFRPLYLMINIAVLLLGSVAMGRIVHRHIQQNRWRFRLIHLMAAMMCVSIGLAFIGYRFRIHRAQIALAAQGGHLFVIDWQPFGPYWLRSLTGARYWSWGDLMVEADIDHSDEITNLPGKASIEVLDIFTVRPDTMPSLDDYHNLLAINMSQVNHDGLDSLGGRDPPFWPCLRVIARRDSIQGLNLHDAGVTDRGLQELARMPNLKNLELAYSMGVTDDGLVHLASIRSLKVLGLQDTGVTEQGVKRLQAALPHCIINWEPKNE